MTEDHIKRLRRSAAEDLAKANEFDQIANCVDQLTSEVGDEVSGFCKDRAQALREFAAADKRRADHFEKYGLEVTRA